MKLIGPIWLMQPIPYLGEEIKGDWIYEEKIDGWRLQVIKYKNGIEFWGRRLEKKPNWTEKLLYLKDIVMESLPENTLIDCELYSEKGRRGIPSLFTDKIKVKPIIYVFDVVFFEGEFVGDRELKNRKEILKNLKFKEPFYLLDYKIFKSFSEVNISNDAEGIILKNLNSYYQVGKEAPVATIDWRKLKYGYK